jgi:hypothetical protein
VSAVVSRLGWSEKTFFAVPNRFRVEIFFRRFLEDCGLTCAPCRPRHTRRILGRHRSDVRFLLWQQLLAREPILHVQLPFSLRIIAYHTEPQSLKVSHSDKTKKQSERRLDSDHPSINTNRDIDSTLTGLILLQKKKNITETSPPSPSATLICAALHLPIIFFTFPTYQ